MTTLLHAGGEMGAFVPSDGSSLESTSPSIAFDAAYARCALRVGITGAVLSYIQSSPLASPQDDLWFHWNFYSASAPPYPIGDQQLAYPFFEVLDDGGAMVFYCTMEATSGTNGQYRMKAYYGAYPTGAQVGDGFTFAPGALHTIDLHISATEYACYLNGTLRDSETVSMVVIDDMQTYRFRNMYTLFYVSECMAADESLVSWRLKTLPITGAGDEQDWGGAFTAINEIVYNDGTFIFSPTADEISTYTNSTDIPDVTIRAVVVTARASRAAAGPQNLQLALRTDATNYFSPTLGLSLGFSGNVGIWMLNPDGGVAWSPAIVEQLQYGVKSIT